MTSIYRIQVRLADGDIRTWYEDGNSAEVIRGRVSRTLFNCNLRDYKVTVQLDS